MQTLPIFFREINCLIFKFFTEIFCLQFIIQNFNKKLFFTKRSKGNQT